MIVVRSLVESLGVSFHVTIQESWLVLCRDKKWTSSIREWSLFRNWLSSSMCSDSARKGV